MIFPFSGSGLRAGRLPCLHEIVEWRTGIRQIVQNIFSSSALLELFDSCDLENSDAGCAEYSPLLLLFGFFQPLGHLFVICSVTRPALRSTIPAVVFDGHINAAVDEELHRLIVSVPDEFVQDACRLMGTPGRVDVRSVLK